MYEVSEQFREAAKSRALQMKIHIKLQINGTEYPLTESNVLQGSFSISNQNSESDNVEIGKVNIGELNITLINVALPRYSLKNARIEPSYSLLVGDRYESVPLGVYHVAEANRTSVGTEITAYDNMAKFDKVVGVTSAQGTMYDFTVLACEECGVDLGMTEDEMKVLPNGAELLNLYPSNDIETWRDLISWAAQTMGCFATMDRNGALVYRTYGIQSVDTLDEANRIEGARFSDFVTRYTGVSVVDIGKETTEYYGLEVDDGLTYPLGSNPFLQNTTRREELARNILTALSAIEYVPFEASLASSAMFYDLGDVLIFENGIADGTKRYCINQIDWTYGNAFTTTGVGQNPALVNARGKTDKALAGLSKTMEKDAYRIDVARNLKEVVCENKRIRRLIRTSVMTQKNAYVKIDAEILIDAKLDPTQLENKIIARVSYQMDSEIEERYPEETWCEGRHILKLMYLMTATDPGFHMFDIYLEMDGGSATIAPYDILVIFSGIGIVANAGWNGQIDIEEDVSHIQIPKMLLNSDPTSERVSIALQEPMRIGKEDSTPPFEIPEMVKENLTDTVGIGDYMSGMTWEEAAAYTWGASRELYVWGRKGEK